MEAQGSTKISDSNLDAPVAGTIKWKGSDFFGCGLAFD